MIGALLATIWTVIFSTGDTKGALPHLFYIPIILAALLFGMWGAVATAVAAAVLCGPLLPVDTLTGEAQSPVAILVSGTMFVAIACASNAMFSEWGATFTDPRLAAAVVDRLTFHAHIINTGTSSCRLRATRAKKGAATT